MSISHTLLLLIERKRRAERTSIFLFVWRLLLGVLLLVTVQVDCFHVLPFRFIATVVATASGVFTHADVYFSENL